MGKRARKPKKIEDASESCRVLEPSHKAKTFQQSGKRSRRTKRCGMNGIHSVLSLPPGCSYALSEHAGGSHLGVGEHGEGEEEYVDVDTIGSDDIISHDLTSVSSGSYTVKEELLQGPGSPINIKPDLLDSRYDFHSGLGCLQEYDIGLINSTEATNRLITYKQDGSAGDAMVPSTSIEDTVPCALSGIDMSSLHGLPSSLPVPGVLHSNDVSTTSTTDAGSLMIPTSLVGGAQGTTATTTAFAQVTKIEEGPDGKGYVLHLNIPALGLADVVLSTPGLSLAPGIDEKILTATSHGALPTLLNISPPSATAVSQEGAALESLSDEGVDNQSLSDTPNLDDFVQDQVDNNLAINNNTAISRHMLENGEVIWDDAESVIFDTEHAGMIEGSSSSSSSDSGCGLAGDPEPSSSGSGPETDCQGSPSSAGLINVARWVEKPEVERFVICSDGPMECVLCAFKTVDYSAFKSHIICSHPCWRITKKLSKNRLLVEKSVKMNVNLVPQTVTPPTGRHRRPSHCKEKDSSKTEQVPSGNGNNGNHRGKKGIQVYQRKKQMLERNKRLFRCSVCMRLFVFEGSIVNHLVDIHLVKTPYDHIQVSNNHGMTFGKIRRCSHDNCYASCVTEEELERHRVESHAQVVCRCQICGFTAESSDAIEKHASLIHNQYDLTYGLLD